ncbi:MAG TPA: hypothetical protein VGV14_19795 [Rhodanobacter sp.]|nr:hypothetical protein [Rhodanobacter sp.]
MRDPFLIKGAFRGPCSICGTQDDLTVDHVPPKGATRVAAMEMRELWARLSTGEQARRFELSQDGVKFRTLCRLCNNVRLGANADPELVALCNHADTILKTKLILPPSFSARVRPMRVLRAIAGHLLATQSGRQPAGPFELGMVSFFLNTAEAPPRELECFYWPYPYSDQVILRDVGMTRLGHGRAPLVFKLLKFYPLAFMLTWARDEQAWDFLMPNLAIHRRISNDDFATVPIDLRSVPHQRWPEAPTDDAALLSGGTPMHATPRTPKKRK